MVARVRARELAVIEPYYDDGQITVYVADCRDVLPQLERCDLLLTDPPYGISRDGQQATTGGHGGRRAHEFMGWDSERPDGDVFAAMLASADEHIIWGGNYFADLLPPTSGWLVWDKGQRINQSDGELAWTSRDGALRIYELNRVALMLDEATHPTQKPLRLIKWCIGFFPDANTILDPFAGSLTTAVAAKHLGRRCIAIEREEKYVIAGLERLRQGVLL